MIITLISGCSSHNKQVSEFHKYKNYNLASFNKNKHHKQALKSLEYSNFNVAIKAGNAFGLGVPISSRHIATVAHVVDRIKINGIVEVFNLGDVKSSKTGKVVYISKMDEVAIIEFDENHNFKQPKLCKNSYGGQYISSSKPADIFDIYSNIFIFEGTVSNIYTLPLVNMEVNQKTLQFSNIDTRAMAGLERVIISINSPAAAGNSGGAIIDINNKCVVALVSMNARVSYFEEPEKLMVELGFTRKYYEGTSPYMMVGIPITHFKIN
jgi:hypothetical protein